MCFIEDFLIIECFKPTNPYMRLHQLPQATVALQKKKGHRSICIRDVTQYGPVLTAKYMYNFCSQLSCHRLRLHVTSSLCHCIGGIYMAA